MTLSRATPFGRDRITRVFCPRYSRAASLSPLLPCSLAAFGVLHLFIFVSLYLIPRLSRIGTMGINIYVETPYPSWYGDGNTSKALHAMSVVTKWGFEAYGNSSEELDLVIECVPFLILSNYLSSFLVFRKSRWLPSVP